jgi:NAD-dependent deacetylase
MGADPKLWLKTLLKGIGQIAFCDRAVQGALVLGAIAFVSLVAAGLALLGAVVGTLSGFLLKLRPENEWREGLSGVNPAVAGLFAAWIFPDSAVGLLSGAALILATILVDAAARPIFRRLRLPELSAPALATVLAAWTLHIALEAPFWPTAVPPALDASMLIPSGLLLCVALWLRSWRGAATTVVLAGIAMLASGTAYGLGPVGPVGLWAFTVAPIAFAAHGVFMAGAWRGVAVALAAAILGSGLWIGWIHSPAASALPPLTLPMLISLWAAHAACGAVWGRAIQIPELWYLAERIRRERNAGRRVVVLTGAGVSTASGIPDYVSGAWFDPNVPAGTYAFSRYQASSRCRRAYWDSCRRFFDLAGGARPNAAHAALTDLQRRGLVTAIITQNVDRLHQVSGAADVVELHGTIGHVRCLDCGKSHDWPPGQPWQSQDLRCGACGGLLKPAVIALGEMIPPQAWRAARRAVRECGVMIIVGSQLAVSSAATLAEEARAEGALLVFLNIGPAYSAGLKADIVIREKAEAILPALALLLDGRGPSARPDTAPSAQPPAPALVRSPA